MKKLLYLILFTFVLLPSLTKVNAWQPNNLYGIHLAVPTEADLEAAARLVNTNGGDWGYVTLVLQDNDLDYNKWQGVFNKLRQLHLIPILRLASHPEGENWAVPSSNTLPMCVDFLNGLNWVTKERYVVLFNEPNHGAEWGGAVDPEGYAKVALMYAKQLKESNPDYYLMLAGLDQSTPEAPPRYLSARSYYQRMVAEFGVENIEKYISGLSSHSYPNPGFMGSPNGSGWGTVRGYLAELEYLSELGVTKALPVFITETGWKRDGLGEDQLAANYLTAFREIWALDSQVRAVTPFLLNYQTDPFLGFSFQKPGENAFFAQYEAIAGLPKISGNPPQRETVVFKNRLPTELVEDSSFRFKLSLANEGQGIWDKADGYELKLISKSEYYYNFSPLLTIAPEGQVELDFDFHTPNTLGSSTVKIGLFKKGELRFSSPAWRIHIIPLQKLTLKYRLLGLTNSGEDFQVEIYDQFENLVFMKRHVSGQSGTINLDKVRNVALGERYRVVLLKPRHLPRQAYLRFHKEGNLVRLAPHLPIDYNNDGKLSMADFWAIFGR